MTEQEIKAKIRHASMLSTCLAAAFGDIERGAYSAAAENARDELISECINTAKAIAAQLEQIPNAKAKP